MNFDDWRYEWIKTAIKNGAPVETATKAFEEYRSERLACDLSRDPALAAQTYILSKLEVE